MCHRMLCCSHATHTIHIYSLTHLIYLYVCSYTKFEIVSSLNRCRKGVPMYSSSLNSHDLISFTDQLTDQLTNRPTDRHNSIAINYYYTNTKRFMFYACQTKIHEFLQSFSLSLPFWLALPISQFAYSPHTMQFVFGNFNANQHQSSLNIFRNC